MAFVEVFVSDQSQSKPRLGYLLLRDGHCIPLRGISPDEIRMGAKNRFLNPEADPIKHQHCLTAIVGCLGFRGDFGTFVHHGWPAFEDFLRQQGCTYRAGLFPADHGGCIDLYFSKHFGPRPRQLADRIFSNPGSPPKRVFLGYGVDWPSWDGGNGIQAPSGAIASICGDPATASRRAQDLFAHRHDLGGQWGFLDDKLVHGPVKNIVDKTYWTLGSDTDERTKNRLRLEAAVKAFRAVFDSTADGWVDVIPYNERLVVLRSCDGGWDLLWRNYREAALQDPVQVSSAAGLHAEDAPSYLMTESQRRLVIYSRQDVWEEWEEHEAEQAFYDRGGSMAERRMTSDADLRLAWLRDRNELASARAARPTNSSPGGFAEMVLDGRKLAVSEMVSVGAFRKMLADTGYGERRPDGREQWERANEGVSDEMPVGASWADAQAFCAWMEREQGIVPRLPTRRELRLLRPAFSPHYERLAERDFPWEHFPPRPITDESKTEGRRDLPSAVLWSEPRFLEPHAELPEFPSDSGVATTSRKRWIADFPPHAAWKNPLPLAEHDGLAFIDAWDACEWCQEKGWASGRFWEGPIGPQSWGAYKNLKITFRLVIELEG